MTKTEISIVVPLFNEEDSLSLLYESITRVAQDLKRSYEIIFVDDGSTDNTFETAKALNSRDRRLKVVKFRKNYGQTPAMQAGFDFSKGDIIVSMDGDLQNDPCDIPRIIQKIDEGYDIVCGWRRDRKDKLISRKIPSKIANWLIGKVTGIDIHDNGCSLKGYRSSVLKKVRLYSEMHRFIPAMTSVSGTRYTEIVVSHHARQFGVSKYGISRVWRVILDLLMIKMIVGFTSRPITWFGLLSLPFLLSGTALSVVSMFLYFGAVPGGGFPIIIPSAAFLFLYLFFHLFLLGFLGEMVFRTGDFKQKEAIDMRSVKIL